MTNWIVHEKKVHSNQKEEIRKHFFSQSTEYIESQLLESNGEIRSVNFRQKYNLEEFKKYKKKFGLFYQEPSTEQHRSYVVLVELTLQDNMARLQFNEKIKNTPLDKHQIDLSMPGNTKKMMMHKTDAMRLATVLNQINSFSQDATNALIQFFCKNKMTADALEFSNSLRNSTILKKKFDLFDPSLIKEVNDEFPIKNKYLR